MAVVWHVLLKFKWIEIIRTQPMFNYECCSVYMIKAKTWKNKPKTQTNWSIDEDFQIDLLNLKKYKINLKTIKLNSGEL